MTSYSATITRPTVHALFFLALVCGTHPVHAQERESKSRSIEWRAVSLDFLGQDQSGDGSFRGSITDVAAPEVRDLINIPYGNPTKRHSYSGPAEMVFRHPPANPGEPGQILATGQIPQGIDRALVVFWPNRKAPPRYRLMFIPDILPRRGERLVHLINFTPEEFYIGVEKERIRLPSLSTEVVECRDSAAERSPVLVYRPPQEERPAQRLFSSSFRFNQGEIVTILIAPDPGSNTPDLHVFRERVPSRPD